MTPDEISAFLADQARRALAEIMTLIRQGAPSREAIEAVAKRYADQAMDGFEQALSAALSDSVGVADIRAYPVGEVTLSANLYAQAAQVSAVAQAIIQQQANAFQSVRELALKLYEGYNFRAPRDEPLQYKPSNPKLPKYLRQLLGDPDVGPSLQSVLARIQAAKLKTDALRAGYLDLINAIEKGAGMARLENKLNVAFAERMRYFTNRIARTELHRASMEERAREWMSPAGDWLKFVRWRLSQRHPKTDICDLHANVDRYGLGPGIYPKAQAPLPPSHPHCFCTLTPVVDLPPNAKARERENSELGWLSRQSASDQALIMGSRAKAQRAIDGESIEGILNEGVPEAYRLTNVGDAPILGIAGRLKANAGGMDPVLSAWTSPQSFQRHLEKRQRMGHVADADDFKQHILDVFENVDTALFATGNGLTLTALETADWAIILTHEGRIKTAYQKEKGSPSFSDNHLRLGYSIDEQAISPRMREALRRVFGAH